MKTDNIVGGLFLLCAFLGCGWYLEHTHYKNCENAFNQYRYDIASIFEEDIEGANAIKDYEKYVCSQYFDEGNPEYLQCTYFKSKDKTIDVNQLHRYKKK